MSWNYRVIKHVDEVAPSLKKLHPNGYVWFAIHEVYYDEKGRPSAYSEHPAKVVGESPLEIDADLRRMRKALKLPVLSKTKFVKKKKT